MSDVFNADIELERQRAEQAKRPPAKRLVRKVKPKPDALQPTDELGETIRRQYYAQQMDGVERIVKKPRDPCCDLPESDHFAAEIKATIDGTWRGTR